MVDPYHVLSEAMVNPNELNDDSASKKHHSRTSSFPKHHENEELHKKQEEKPKDLMQAKQSTRTINSTSLAPNGIISKKIGSHGFGVDLRSVARFLKKAISQGKELRIQWKGDGWIYAQDAACPKADMTCFFELPNMTYLQQHPPKTDEEIYRYLLRPNQRTQQDLDELGHMSSPEPCGVMHVRHADTILNRGWRDQSMLPVYKYLEFKTYFEVFKNVAPSNMKNIVLLTDDQNVIDEVPLYNGTDGFHFHYIQRKRFRGAEGGWENHFPSGSRKGELLTLLRIRELASKCKLWVGTKSSFATIIRALMDQLPRIVHLDNDNRSAIKELLQQKSARNGTITAR